MQNNVLFIGNGFDLSNGLKTRYIDYLDSLEIEDIEEVLFYFNILRIKEVIVESKVGHSKTLESKTVRLSTMGESLITLSNDLPLPFEKIGKGLRINERKEVKELDEENQLHLLYLAVNNRVISGRRDNEISISNRTVTTVFLLDQYMISYEKFIDLFKQCELKYKESVDTYLPYYIKYLLNLKKDTRPEEFRNLGDNWIDVEHILYHNQFSDFLSVCEKQSAFTTGSYVHAKYDWFLRKMAKDINPLDDFNTFKLNFLGYLKREQDKVVATIVEEKVKKICDYFSPNIVYNFNYTTYANKFFEKEIDGVIVDNLHGNIECGEAIVFGTNHYLFNKDISLIKELIKTDERIRKVDKIEKYPEWVKMYQVLGLEDKRREVSLESVDSLTIIGHSIGEQDFEYMHTIINTNPKEIVINVVWAMWEINGIECNNRIALKEAVYKMLSKYEEIYGDITIHRMILENRIKFISAKMF